MSDATPALVLYDFSAVPPDERWASYSPYVLEVERALQLARLPFQLQRVPYPKIRQLNPLGQLPVLRIGAERVSDSSRILRRIEALAPGALTFGLDGRGAAEAWLWEELADTALYPYVLATRWIDARGYQVTKEAFFGKLPRALRLVVPGMVRLRYKRGLLARDFLRTGLGGMNERLAQVLDDLDARAPDGGYWLGAYPTIADLGLFAHLHALRLPETPWRAAEITRRARLSAWLDRVAAATRPGTHAGAPRTRDTRQLN